jgi:peptidoglycan hydrolase-like protein with peptidoglycan-binding domain
MRVGTARVNDGGFGGRRPLWMPFVLRWMVPRSRDAIAGLIAVVGGIAILVNALFMQSGPHPAPIFANKPAPLVAPSFGPVVAMLPKAGDDKAAMATPVRPRGELVTDIQRELTKRGFYEGAADGVYGPKTDAAIRDFEQAAGLRASAEPSEVLLTAIAKSSVKAAPAPAGARKDPIAELLAPNKRLIAIQRALADFGYGPVQATGVHDAPTRSAIERFERARKRPVTGNVNEQLVRDLAAMTGRPLEW